MAFVAEKRMKDNRCPDCEGPLELIGSRWTCIPCRASYYPAWKGYLEVRKPYRHTRDRWKRETH